VPGGHAFLGAARSTGTSVGEAASYDIGARRVSGPLLELRAVTMRFGGVTALDKLSLALGEGEIQGLIGPNGSGKSTAFNVVTGLYRPAEGEIAFQGQPITGLRPDQIAGLGIARTFQHLRLFGQLSVLDNVMTGTHLRADPPSPIETLFGLPRFRRYERELRELCMAVLEQLQIADVASQLARSLPYGTQKRVDLARSLVSEPRLLLLDEPAAGLNEADSRHLLELIAALHETRKLAILVVEHNMHFIGGLCRQINVIDFGRLLARGDTETVRRDPEVIRAYLGEPAKQAARAAPAETEPEAATEPALAVEGLEVRYGAVPAIRGIDLSAPDGKLTAIVGANGAGKSTLLSAISGLLPAYRGRIAYHGADVTAWDCERRVAVGIVLCPEGRRLFPSLTVRENLLLGAYSQRDAARSRRTLDKVLTLFPRVAERGNQAAGTLSGGEQQMVAIGRALMAEPRLLLLDEPSLGLAPNLVQLIFEMIEEIRRLGTTTILVEQNASMALAIADLGYLLENGRVGLAGPAAELLQRREVVEVYLG